MDAKGALGRECTWVEAGVDGPLATGLPLSLSDTEGAASQPGMRSASSNSWLLAPAGRGRDGAQGVKRKRKRKRAGVVNTPLRAHGRVYPPDGFTKKKRSASSEHPPGDQSAALQSTCMGIGLVLVPTPAARLLLANTSSLLRQGRGPRRAAGRGRLHTDGQRDGLVLGLWVREARSHFEAHERCLRRRLARLGSFTKTGGVSVGGMCPFMNTKHGLIMKKKHALYTRSSSTSTNHV